MIRIAMLGKWHVHATDYEKQIRESGEGQVTAVWDDDAQRGQAWADELGVDYFASLDELLDRPDIDAVVCNTATTHHKEILTRAAHAGKHIFTEKVLAPTVDECLAIAAAVTKANVKFVISFPQLSFPDSLLIRDLLDERKLGEITSLRIRNAHAGLLQGWLPSYWMNKEEAGGGALMDLGCHPVYLANAMLGEPRRVTAVMSSPFGSATDEAATIMVEYAKGRAAVLETSLISWNSPRLVELYGSGGSFISVNGQARYSVKDETGDDYTVPELPEHGMMPMKVFLRACRGEAEVPQAYGLEAAIRLTRVMEAAYRSAEEGITIAI